jgi:hypothetical protein
MLRTIPPGAMERHGCTPEGVDGRKDDNAEAQRSDDEFAAFDMGVLKVLVIGDVVVPVMVRQSAG